MAARGQDNGNWRIVPFFFACLASSALLISGRIRTSINLNLPNKNNLTLATSPASYPMLYGCTIYTIPHQQFQLSSLSILQFGVFSSGCSKLPQSMPYLDCCTTHSFPDVGFSLSSICPWACWPLSHPSCTFPPHPALLILMKICYKYARNMLEICRIICKICRIYIKNIH